MIDRRIWRALPEWLRRIARSLELTPPPLAWRPPPVDGLELGAPLRREPSGLHPDDPDPIAEDLAVPTIIDRRGALRAFGERQGPPQAIVYHVTVTNSPAQTVEVLNRRGLSTHYEVDQQGNVYQYLDPSTQVGWHAGRGNNYDSIGVDLTHMPWSGWPVAQLEAARWLTGRLLEGFPIPPRVAPDRCSRLDGRTYRGCGPTQALSDVIAAGHGLVRHRNLAAKDCPEDFPIASMTRGGDLVAVAPRDGSAAPEAPGPSPGAESSSGGGGAAVALVIAAALLSA